MQILHQRVWLDTWYPNDKIQRMRSWRWLVKYFQLNFRSKWVEVEVEVEVEVPNLVNLAWRWSLTTGELRQRIIELRLCRRPQILSINYCAGPRIRQTNRIHSFHESWTMTLQHVNTQKPKYCAVLPAPMQGSSMNIGHLMGSRITGGFNPWHKSVAINWFSWKW